MAGGQAQFARCHDVLLSHPLRCALQRVCRVRTWEPAAPGAGLATEFRPRGSSPPRTVIPLVDARVLTLVRAHLRR